MKKFIPLLLIPAVLIGCSSSPKVQKQNYAKLRTERTYEKDFDVVWNAIERTFQNHAVRDRDPEEVSKVELKKLTRRTLETDWIYSKSNDKYITYKVDDFMRKKYLQVRVKYYLVARSVIGGTKVEVSMEEEIERLDDMGKPEGYEGVSELDTSRANKVLEDIKYHILGGR